MTEKDLFDGEKTIDWSIRNELFIKERDCKNKIRLAQSRIKEIYEILDGYEKDDLGYLPQSQVRYFIDAIMLALEDNE